ncbi:MAG: tetratricopeptide repeat protein [Treponema sp.]|nr:tetratricopeptide repeat protein [Treponema sp.]
MNLTLVIIIVLIVSIGFLLFFIVNTIILPKRAAKAADKMDRNRRYKTIRMAKSMIEKDPQNAEAHYLLGKAYLADKREEQALREFKSVSRLGIEGKNISEFEFREAIAALYVKFREEEEALKEYVLLIKKNPENPAYYYEAGKLFTSRNRPDLAEQYLRRAIALNPKEGSYRFELGHLYYITKRIKEAGTEFEAALKLNPTDGNILLFMGKILKDSKDFAGAVPYLEKASRTEEYRLRSLVELGSCYMSLKMMEKAASELERAVNCIQKEDEPDSIYARYFLAMCYEKTQEFTKAVAQWDKIYAIKKNFRDVGEKLTQYIEYRQENTDKENTKKA